MKPSAALAKPSLPSSVCSSQDVMALQFEVHAYSGWLAHETTKKKMSVASTSEPPTLSAGAVETIKSWCGDQPVTLDKLESLAKALETYRAAAPTLTITLAAPPSNGLKATLVAWCRENLAADALVNFQFNGTLLGGMVVRCGSRIFDWSFRRQILDARSSFPEVLRHV